MENISLERIRRRDFIRFGVPLIECDIAFGAGYGCDPVQVLRVPHSAGSPIT